MITITHQGKILAMIIPADYHAEGIQFFTPDDFSQQMAYMHHPAGHLIEPHFHNKISRKVFYTQEVLFIKKGKLEVDFYDDIQNYLDSSFPVFLNCSRESREVPEFIVPTLIEKNTNFFG